MLHWSEYLRKRMLQRLLTRAMVWVLIGLVNITGTAIADPIDVWIGTGGSPSKGIYHCVLDRSSGRLSESVREWSDRLTIAKVQS
jgi:hypothetical protein